MVCTDLGIGTLLEEVVLISCQLNLHTQVLLVAAPLFPTLQCVEMSEPAGVALVVSKNKEAVAGEDDAEIITFEMMWRSVLLEVSDSVSSVEDPELPVEDFRYFSRWELKSVLKQADSASSERRGRSVWEERMGFIRVLTTVESHKGGKRDCAGDRCPRSPTGH